jgi:hypothetical protein
VHAPEIARVAPGASSIRHVRGLIASRRYSLPMAAAVVCCIVASFMSPILQWLFVVAAFGFVLDAATAWFERAGGTGGMHDYKQ